jgi:uncharacterized protein
MRKTLRRSRVLLLICNTSLAKGGTGAGSGQPVGRELRQARGGGCIHAAGSGGGIRGATQVGLEELRQSLRPERVTQSNLPGDLVHDWTAPDGRARVELAPKGDPNDDETLRRFARAARAKSELPSQG